MNELHEKIKRYYDDSQVFYDWFWMNKKNLGMHYGLWEEGTKSLHEAIINENKVVADNLNHCVLKARSGSDYLTRGISLTF